MCVGVPETKTGDEKKSERKETNKERDESSDHLQSATIAGESIFVMNCGSVTPTAEPILLLQVYKFPFLTINLKPKT